MNCGVLATKIEDEAKLFRTVAPSSLMVRFAAHDLEGTIDLLEQHHTGKVMR